MNTAQLRLASVDDVLGPAESRFFGSGFRRVEQRLRDLRVRTDADGIKITATGSVRYPADWSRKAAGTALRPHLSTIDAVVLGAQLAEICLTHLHRLGREERRRLTIRRLTLTAGTNAQEDLDNFPVSGTCHLPLPDPTGPGRMISRVDVQMGTMRAVLDIGLDEPAQEPYAPPDADCATVEEFLGHAEDRYYGTAYRQSQYAIEDVRLAPHDQRIEARVRIGSPAGREQQLSGMEAAWAPSASMLDAIVCIAQLAQVLMYHSDRVSRSQSNTLWMRRVELTTITPARRVSGPFRTISTAISNRLVEVGNGTWRVSDFDLAFHGIHGTYSLAHELPAHTAYEEPAL